MTSSAESKSAQTENTRTLQELPDPLRWWALLAGKHSHLCSAVTFM
jgi:hypothetical protein